MVDFKSDNVTLLKGACVVRMAELPDSCVDLWMTSPPYAAQRDYGSNVSASKLGEEYITWFLDVAKEAHRTLTDTGSFVINIKEHVCKSGAYKGQRDLYVFKLIIAMVEELGFRFIDEYIWNKTNPFPTGAKTRLKDGYERCLHFTKGNTFICNPDSVKVQSTSKWLEAEKRRNNKGAFKVTNNSGMDMSRRVAEDMVRPSNVITGSTSCVNVPHNAVYPLYLPEFFIKLLTNEGHVVGDMFSGWGTTVQAALGNNRKSIGIELGICEKKGHAYDGMHWNDVVVARLGL